MSNINKIYTIGYSSFTINEFINVLKQYNINCVIDVRSKPYSKYHTDYNKPILEKILEDNKLLYRNYAEEFGAQQTDESYYTNGYVDFDKFTKSQLFKNGFNKIIAGIDLGYTFVIMCAEKDPATCHRNIMVAKEFFKQGYQIKNILADSSTEMQNELETRLVDLYFKNRDQISLFDDDLSFEEMVKHSYKKRNEEIGFRKDSQEEQFNE